MLIALSCLAHSGRAQERIRLRDNFSVPPLHLQRVTPPAAAGSLRIGNLQQGTTIEKTGNIVALSSDHMPCLVPDMALVEPMPVKRLPGGRSVEPMPNGIQKPKLFLQRARPSLRKEGAGQ